MRVHSPARFPLTADDQLLLRSFVHWPLMLMLAPPSQSQPRAIERRRPHPEILRYVRRILGGDEECLDGGRALIKEAACAIEQRMVDALDDSDTNPDPRCCQCTCCCARNRGSAIA